MKWGQGCLFLIAFLTFGLFVASESFAQVPPFYRSARDEAMGGASAAVVDDYTSLFLNPAGLGKIRGPVFNVVNPEIEIDSDLSAALGSSLTNPPTTPQSILNLQTQSPDKPFHTNVQLFPSFVTTNFGIGALYNTTFDSKVTSATNTFNLNYVNDIGAVIGYDFRFWEGRIKLGFSGKILNRVEIPNVTIPTNSTGLSFQSLAAEGGGAGWDAGLILTAPWSWLPTLAIAAQDIGNTYFNLGSGYFYKTGIRPPPQMQSINAGIAVFPIFTHSVRSSFTAQVNDIQNIQTQDTLMNFHAGAELDFGDVLYLRAGMNQHYYTAGVEFDFGHNQVQATTYGEDIGTPAQMQEDRRFVLMYGFRM